MKEPGNILIIRFSSLGDLVLTTPIYRELRKIYPRSMLTLLTSEGFGSVMNNNPHLDRILKHPRRESWKKLSELIRTLKRERFDLIYDAHCSLRSRWIVWQITAFGLKSKPRVWTIDKRSLKRQLLVRLKINRLKDGLPQRLQWILPLQSGSSEPLEDHTELFPDEEEVKNVQLRMEKNGLQPGRFLALAPSASHPLKCWPLVHFRNLARMMLDAGWPIVLVGGPDEPEPELLKQEFGERMVNFAGRLSPLESAEVLRHAKRLVTNDTSLGHMAEALGTPSVVLFGPTVKEFGYAPFLPESRMMETGRDLNCRPCSKEGRGVCRNSETLVCLDSIAPQTVYDALELPGTVGDSSVETNLDRAE